MSSTPNPKTIKDPHAKREAKNYENPIASRELLLELIAAQSAPANLKHLAQELNYSDETQIEGLRRRLQAMVRDGQIFKNRRDGFMDFSHMDLIKGRIQAHPDGFGFLIPEDGSKDIFMSARHMTKLLNGDIVAVKVIQFDERRSRREGELVKIITRAHTSIIGRYYDEKGVSYVIPDDKRLTQDILISNKSTLVAKHEDIVVVEITEYPRFKRQAVGVIKQVLGEDNAPGMEVTIALNTHDIPHHWSDELKAETAKFETKVSAKESQDRLDLREKQFITIDGADARDFDDAVFCERHDSGFTLWVAIADVSHYVKINSALDQEATLRGTSVYFPGEVVPMLPEVLSNGLCSLNPHVDRLTMVCEMQIGVQGAIKDYQFHEGVIYSHHRLTYDQAAEIIFEDKTEVEGIEDVSAVKPILEDLKNVYRALQKARKRRKALEFDTKEVFFEFNNERKIENIHQTVRNEAHQLIEECMVSANQCAAKFLKKHKVPTLFRNHEGPNSKKLEDLHTFLGMYGLRMGGDPEQPTAKDYSLIIEAIKQRPDFALIQTVLLRSMLQASYTPERDIGHFGLSLKDYAHFTSPIRRYPDLLVHRGIRHILQNGSSKGFEYSLSQMEQLGDSCSTNERRADEATRDAADYLKCEFLVKHIGDQFDGIVTSVTSFGLFVQINDLLIDGLVHVTSLSRDYYQFDAGKQRLTGEKTGQTFRLGDSLRVEVVRVDMQDKKIDFVLVENDKEKTQKPKKAAVIPTRTKSKSKTQPAKKQATKEPIKEPKEKHPEEVMNEPTKQPTKDTVKENTKKPIWGTVKKKIVNVDVDVDVNSTTKPKPLSKAEYNQSRAEEATQKAPEIVAPIKKQAKKKIKLSKQEKKTKAKKERKDAFKAAIPKHQKRKNKNKGKPKHKSKPIKAMDPNKIDPISNK
ncbi:MAG: ribonuclease R [Gammaproteobacteria bacterium]|nr:ribonuclease R [Gammaproteobacteria bacterium]